MQNSGETAERLLEMLTFSDVTLSLSCDSDILISALSCSVSCHDVLVEVSSENAITQPHVAKIYIIDSGVMTLILMKAVSGTAFNFICFKEKRILFTFLSF